ncbi:MAG: phosphoribosylformylglycinamidine synthase [Erysipelotrichaceae bacterium]
MNKRIYVTKREAYRIEANDLCQDMVENLGLKGLESVRLYNIYDIFNGEQEDVELLKRHVCSEPVTDEVMDSLDLSNQTFIAFENISGQYDQRADSAQHCLMLLNNKQDVVIKSGKIVVLEGSISNDELETIKHYLINPVEMCEKDLSLLEYNEEVDIEPVDIVHDFRTWDEKTIETYRIQQGLAMSFDDLIHIQNYYNKEEHRDPTITEIKVLDTYWSDHCRHTTFETILQNVTIEKGKLQDQIQKAYDHYLSLRKEVHNNRKVMTLMDMATIAGKHLRKTGYLDNLEVSEEINACSIEIEVDVNGTSEPWLLMFKNETHNHPTEIEPFGGASTCIGGAIRDPLSGRSYVYQAMRITGAGDITKEIKDTLPNKLPQRVISKRAAHGYSSYGNQIGLATTYVKEIYHEGYVAKRMEVGAVVGAAPKSWVKREEPLAGDIVILLGGATGRDGIGGATGSSKEHNETSLSKCSSEVQKGNAPMERRLQRLFRNPEVTQLIKRSNDFGAGGVSVAIGELAAGIAIDLDVVPVKYAGLNGTELAISESQERMAVVVEASDFDKFKKLAYSENLDATKVAVVTDDNRLVMKFKGQTIVDISRDFLDTNGVRQSQDVIMQSEFAAADPFIDKECEHNQETFLNNLKKENVASQKGLVEMFDSTIGKSTVLMPYGGKYQLSESEGSIQKLPVDGFTNTCSAMSYGYNVDIACYSPYLAGSYSVIEALARLSAMGIDYKQARLSCQEYFERLHKDAKRWGKPMQALLGVIEAQEAFKTAAIGGKDSMSGTYKDICVPPTIITFAVAPGEVDHVISTEFKEKNHYVYLLKHHINDDHSANYDELNVNFTSLYKNIVDQKIVSASTIKVGGISEAIAKMCFGNKIGVNITTDENLYSLMIGSILIESNVKITEDNYILLGETNDSQLITINKVDVAMKDAIDAWMSRYEKLYPTMSDHDGDIIKTPIYHSNIKVHSKHKTHKPKVIIPVFPGTNCEYDTREQFVRAGAEVEIYVFNNLNVESIQRSLKELSEKIASAQILTLVGGFSSGDEPDGSGKFIANVLSNEYVNKAVQTLLSNDGLILGICNGFQALIKSGLLPYGDISKLDETSPTLFRNNINRHVSRIAKTRITSNKSPWLMDMKPGECHNIAYSHGEGKFVIDEISAKALFENGQVATQYTNEDGEVSMNGAYNINGSSYAIEGITSEDGRIFGKMGHSERYEEGLFKNIDGNKVQNIFKNGVNYFLK